jgi:hypothetical protein
LASPAVVLLIVLAGDAGDPATEAVVPALRRPLGEGTVVLVQQAESPPTDSEAIELARRAHAVSTATLAWEGTTHDRAHLRVLRVEHPARYQYDLVFGPADAPAERGRAAGLALAPLVMQTLAAERGSPSSQPGAEPAAAAPEPVAAPAHPAEPAGGRGSAPPDRRFALDLAAMGSVGIGGSALGAGPSLALRARVWGPFAVRAIGIARFGEIEAASATASAIAGGGGVAWRFGQVGPSGRGRIDFALGADVMAMQLAVWSTTDGATARRDRWITAFDARLEVAWAVSTPVALFATFGPELLAGSTAVTVGGATVDHIPALRVVGELGVRAPF